MANREQDAWALLIQCGELPPEELYSPGKAAEGAYSERLKLYRQQQAATEDLDLAAPDRSRPKTTEDKLAALEREAEAQLDRPFSRRLTYMRAAAAEVGIVLRDNELQQLLHTARRRRDGREVLVGNRALDMTPTPWLVEGLLMARALNLLVAGPKVGKTSLALSLIGRWSRGAEQFLGLQLVGPCPPVLLMGADMPENDWGRMLMAEGLVDSSGKPAAPIVGLSTSGSDWQLDEVGIELVVDHARRFPGLLVIVDSLKHATRLSGIDENSAAADGPLRELDAALDGTGATSLVIHHAGKPKPGGGPSPTLASRGSSAIPAAASQVIGMERVAAEEGSKDRRVILRTEGRGGLPIELLIERSPDWGWVTHGDAAQVARERRLQAAEDKLTDRQADVLDLVRTRGSEGLATVAEDVTYLVDGLLRSARRTLDQLADKGLIEAVMESTGMGRRKTYRPRREGVRSPCTSAPDSVTHVTEVTPPPENLTGSIAENPVGERDGSLRSHRSHRSRLDGGEVTPDPSRPDSDLGHDPLLPW